MTKWTGVHQFLSNFQSNLNTRVVELTTPPVWTPISSWKNSKFWLWVGAGVALFHHFPFERFLTGIPVIVRGSSGTITDSEKYSSYPTSTTSLVRTPVRPDCSNTIKHSTRWAPNHLSDELWDFLQRAKVTFHAFFRSLTESSVEAILWLKRYVLADVSSSIDTKRKQDSAFTGKLFLLREQRFP